MKYGSNKQVMRRKTIETSGGGVMSGFSKTGKDGRKKGQFSPKTPGNTAVGFKQKTPKQATAAMQGKPIPSGSTMSSKPARRDATKQFTNAPGKRVF